MRTSTVSVGTMTVYSGRCFLITKGGRRMLQFLFSTLLILVLILVFRELFIRLINNNPTSIKTTFGKWFSLEATFEGKTSKTRN